MIRLPKFNFYKFLRVFRINMQYANLFAPITFMHLCRNNVTNIQQYNQLSSISKHFGSVTSQSKDISDKLFEVICQETLESLTEYFEELVDTNPKFNAADVSYNNGVLTINLVNHGTYVINRQTPNKQIWLSSPISGPKRYDYVVDGDFWWYKHENCTLHELLKSELTELFKETIHLSNCAHSKNA